MKEPAYAIWEQEGRP
ncbi:hypothetical protein ACFLXC_00325 [Chloroflexota bacterium]